MNSCGGGWFGSTASSGGPYGQLQSQVRIPAMPITRSGGYRAPVPEQGEHLSAGADDAGVAYFDAFFVPVKLSALRKDSPPSLSRWALWMSRSQMASATVASPMAACHWSVAS